MGESTLTAPESTLVIGGREFKIGPLVFAKRARLVKFVTDEVARLRELNSQLLAKAAEAGEAALEGNASQAELMRIAAELFGERLVHLYAIVLDADAAFLSENLTLRDEAALWVAFLEVNDLPFVFSAVRQIRSRVQGLAKT